MSLQCLSTNPSEEVQPIYKADQTTTRVNEPVWLSLVTGMVDLGIKWDHTKPENV